MYSPLIVRNVRLDAKLPSFYVSHLVAFRELKSICFRRIIKINKVAMLIVMRVYKISHAPITECIKYPEEVAEVFVAAIRRYKIGIAKV